MNGDPVSQDDLTDVPLDDGNQCTGETCAGSPAAPAHPGKTEGTVCTSAQGVSVQGGRCNGATVCTPTFAVVRVGDGNAALSKASTAVFVERHYFDSDGALVPNGLVTMPIAVNGDNQPLTMTGTSSSEGIISLSTDGHYLSVAGYGAAPGMGSNGTALCVFGTGCTGAINATSSANLNRIVGRIDSMNNIDTRTRLTTAFSANNVRSALTQDGTVFWVTGAGGATAGVQFIAFAASTSAQIQATPASTRAIAIVGGQLYASSNANPTANVFTVGTDVPTSGPQTATSLPGMSTASGPSPFQFLLLDRDPAVAGLDTLYVADDRAIASGGGIQKYTFNGTTWSLKATFSDGMAVTAGALGLTGMVTPGSNTYTLLATTAAEASGNKIVMYVDDGLNTTPTGTVLTNGTAPANTAYRGLALAP